MTSGENPDTAAVSSSIACSSARTRIERRRDDDPQHHRTDRGRAGRRGTGPGVRRCARSAVRPTRRVQPATLRPARLHCHAQARRNVPGVDAGAVRWRTDGSVVVHEARRADLRGGPGHGLGCELRIVTCVFLGPPGRDASEDLRRRTGPRLRRRPVPDAGSREGGRRLPVQRALAVRQRMPRCRHSRHRSRRWPRHRRNAAHRARGPGRRGDRGELGCGRYEGHRLPRGPRRPTLRARGDDIRARRRSAGGRTDHQISDASVRSTGTGRRDARSRARRSRLRARGRLGTLQHHRRTGQGNRPAYKTGLAKAEADLRSARAFFYEVTEEVWELAESGRPITDEHKALLRLGATQAAHVGRTVVLTAFDLAGTGAIYESHPLQRYLQDALVPAQHAMLQTNTFEAAGSILLGLDAGIPSFP